MVSWHRVCKQLGCKFPIDNVAIEKEDPTKLGLIPQLSNDDDHLCHKSPGLMAAAVVPVQYTQGYTITANKNDEVRENQTLWMDPTRYA